MGHAPSYHANKLTQGDYLSRPLHRLEDQPYKVGAAWNLHVDDCYVQDIVVLQDRRQLLHERLGLIQLGAADEDYLALDEVGDGLDMHKPNNPQL